MMRRVIFEMNLEFWTPGVYNEFRNKYRGACVSRLRGSHPTSTLT